MAREQVLLVAGPEDREYVGKLADATFDVVRKRDVLVHVLYRCPDGGCEGLRNQMEHNPTPDTLNPDEIADRHQSVQAIIDHLTEHGIDADVSGRCDGEEVGAVVNQIQNLDVDMVVIGGSERSPAGNATFGDCVQKLLLNVPSPVLYVKRS